MLAWIRLLLYFQKLFTGDVPTEPAVIEYVGHLTCFDLDSGTNLPNDMCSYKSCSDTNSYRNNGPIIIPCQIGTSASLHEFNGQDPCGNHIDGVCSCPTGYDDRNGFCVDVWGFHCSKTSDSCYYVNTVKLHWDQAQVACAEKNALLVSLETEQKHDEVTALIRTEYSKDDYWIGGRNAKLDGNWQWITNAGLVNFSFTDWSSDGPDNFLGHEYYASLSVSRSSTIWFDGQNRKNYYSICEYKKSSLEGLPTVEPIKVPLICEDTYDDNCPIYKSKGWCKYPWVKFACAYTCEQNCGFIGENAVDHSTVSCYSKNGKNFPNNECSYITCVDDADKVIPCTAGTHSNSSAKHFNTDNPCSSGNQGSCACPSGYEDKNGFCIDSNNFHCSKISNSCYYVYTEKLDWDRAQAVCRNKGAYLVGIETAEENYEIGALINTGFPFDEPYWLGGKDEEKDGNWQWIMGNSTVDFSFTDWSWKEPNYDTSINNKYVKLRFHEYGTFWSQAVQDTQTIWGEQLYTICEYKQHI